MSIVITGSIAYDYLMTFSGKFREQILLEQLENLSLSFLVDSMKRERGGVAANIAYTMKLLGGEPLLFATVGQDFGDYRRWLVEQTISTEHIIEIANDFTASFFVSTDQEQNQIANFYTGAMAHARNYSLSDRGLTDAALVVVSPNDPVAMLNYAQECRELNIPFAYDPSQQVAFLGGDELKQSIPGATYLFGNGYELAVIEKITGWNLSDLRAQVQNVIVTHGEKGSTIYAADEVVNVPAATISSVVDPTGAGDAFRGGFFAAKLAGLAWEQCGKVASLCGAYALENLGTTSHSFSWAEFIDRYEATFEREPALEHLHIAGIPV
ncbi:carbohydrate kinase family protein [Chloroflexi bacterium TSY]|nr:carbohydrate kinase family protein [Chloroflexi bacterium TSY]